jgi:hypothetical protein
MLDQEVSSFSGEEIEVHLAAVIKEWIEFTVQPTFEECVKLTAVAEVCAECSADQMFFSTCCLQTIHQSHLLFARSFDSFLWFSYCFENRSVFSFGAIEDVICAECQFHTVCDLVTVPPILADDTVWQDSQIKYSYCVISILPETMTQMQA